MKLVSSVFKKVRAKGLAYCQAFGAAIQQPNNRQMQLALLAIGVGALSVGIVTGAIAQDAAPGAFNGERMQEAVVRIFQYIEGSFGALVMVAAGLGAILSSAFGQYRAALGCLIVAVGAFILRSVVHTFFNVNDEGSGLGGGGI